MHLDSTALSSVSQWAPRSSQSACPQDDLVLYPDSLSGLLVNACGSHSFHKTD